MDQRTKEIVDDARERYGLHDYYLHRFDIVRSTTIFRETAYTLCMEWFPTHIKDWKDEFYNPKGTVSLEIDIHSRKLQRLIFTERLSYVESLKFDFSHRDEIIKWIEKHTGLIYEKQFEYWKEEKDSVHFKECFNGVRVSPSGYIEFKLNEEGRLTLFSAIGQFPSDQQVKNEKYQLTIEQVEELVREQIKYFVFPVMKQKKIVPAFALEEIYVKNDGSSTLPFQFIVDDKFSIEIDKLIEWEEPLVDSYQKKPLTIIEEVIPEQAFASEPHPDLQPITEEEVYKCMNAVQILMRQKYANESGKWTVVSLHREKGYIHATLKKKEHREWLFNRKLKLFIDTKKYEVFNFMDNEPLLDMYKELKEPEDTTITNEKAFEKLKELIEMTPYYVYDFKQGSYVLCGKMDCQYAVRADNGEVVELNDW